MVINHIVKIDPEYFDDVVNKVKKFEVRKNDRNYKVGNIIELREFNRKRNEYTGRTITAEITYILDNEEYVKENYVIFALEILDFNFETYLKAIFNYKW